MNILEKKELRFLIILLIIIALFFGYKYLDRDFEILKTQISDNSQIDEVVDESEFIWVDIDGAVNNPGVYKIKNNARLFELISIAGGLNNDAYTKDINRSIRLFDEDKIYIKSIDEIDIEKESHKIDINTATKEQLMKLNGIGEAISSNILIYRETNNFKKIEDIMNVNGIGESKFNSIKEDIKVN
ncbi:MAG: ComEA family DNA-binding protein [Bacillota bacterium]|nr:ComEA family DNA-binding protein [Bacillota bacterium]